MDRRVHWYQGRGLGKSPWKGREQGVGKEREKSACRERIHMPTTELDREPRKPSLLNSNLFLLEIGINQEQ